MDLQVKDILAHKNHGSSVVEKGIAIPHTKNKGVKALSLTAITVPARVYYEALDDDLSNILFMIAAPVGDDVHIYVLAKLMTILMDEDFRARLFSAKTRKNFSECGIIIVAADKSVEMLRFDSKKVISKPKIPEVLINRIETNDAFVYHHTGAKAADSSSDP